MLKKSITYDDYNEVTRTEDFYFNFTKLEVIELEVKYDGGLEGYIKRIEETENGKDAYYLFKDIVLAAYGEKSEDGKHFFKSEKLRNEFEASPAMAEMIIGFLNNPADGAKFIEGCLPARLIAAAKAEAALKSDQPELPLPTPSPYPVLVEDVKEPGLSIKQMNEMTREELLAALEKNTVTE